MKLIFQQFQVVRDSNANTFRVFGLDRHGNIWFALLPPLFHIDPQEVQWAHLPNEVMVPQEKEISNET